MTTSEAARVVSAQLGIVPALSERAVNSRIRSWPVTDLPPVENGRRRWRAEHVERLRSELEAGRAQSAG